MWVRGENERQVEMKLCDCFYVSFTKTAGFLGGAFCGVHKVTSGCYGESENVQMCVLSDWESRSERRGVLVKRS